MSTRPSRPRPQPPAPSGRQRVWDRAVQGILALVLWWAVYFWVLQGYGQAGAIVAATCAAWGFVLVSGCAVYFLNRAGDELPPRGPPGPRGPSGRWPGAPP